MGGVGRLGEKLKGWEGRIGGLPGVVTDVKCGGGNVLSSVVVTVCGGRWLLKCRGKTW